MSDFSLATAMAPTPAPGPTCAQHPEMPSIDTCSRCGTFLCAQCRVRETPPRCAACDARASDPLGILADEFAVGRALKNGLTLFVRVLPWAALSALVFGLPWTFMERQLLASGMDQWRVVRFSVIYEGTIGLVGQLICYSAMISVAEGCGWSPTQILGRSVRLWPRLFGTNFLASLWIIGGLILLVIPGVMVAFRLLVTTALVARGLRGDILAASTSLTVGHRWRLVGMFCVVGVLIAGGITVATLPTTVLFSDTDPPFALSLIEGWASDLVMITVDAMILSAFYGLAKTRGEPLSPVVE